MASPRPGRIPSLDGLRAVSIAFVLLAHLSGTRHFAASPYFGAYGNFGVRVFFVISGFLITTLLLDERARTRTISLRDFYVRRAFRIFPAAYAFLAVVVATHWATLSWGDVLTAVTYTSNYWHGGPWVTGHLWSLSVEEQFYLLWPLALLLFYRRRLAILVAAIALGPVCRVVFWRLWGYEALAFPFPVVMDAVAMGCLLAVLRPRLEARAGLLTGRAFLVVPVVTVLLPLLQFDHNRIYQTVGLTVMHAGIALCLLHAIRQEYRLLDTGWVTWIGTLSYSLYLWQQPFLDRHAPGPFTAFPLNLVLVFSAATVSYYGVERPLRARLRAPAPRATVAVPRPDDPVLAA